MKATAAYTLNVHLATVLLGLDAATLRKWGADRTQTWIVSDPVQLVLAQLEYGAKPILVTPLRSNTPAQEIENILTRHARVLTPHPVPSLEEVEATIAWLRAAVETPLPAPAETIDSAESAVSTAAATIPPAPALIAQFETARAVATEPQIVSAFAHLVPAEDPDEPNTNLDDSDAAWEAFVSAQQDIRENDCNAGPTIAEFTKV